MSEFVVDQLPITKEQLGQAFALNARLIQNAAEGLSHAGSVAQALYEINCFNWVLGHILTRRDDVLALLGVERLLSPAQRERYVSGSPPITADGEDVVDLGRLLDVLGRGQEGITAGLAALPPAELWRPVPVGEQEMPLGRRLHGFYFHDTYHTGQLDILRQIAAE